MKFGFERLDVNKLHGVLVHHRSWRKQPPVVRQGPTDDGTTRHVWVCLGGVRVLTVIILLQRAMLFLGRVSNSTVHPLLTALSSSLTHTGKPSPSEDVTQDLFTTGSSWSFFVHRRPSLLLEILASALEHMSKHTPSGDVTLCASPSNLLVVGASSRGVQAVTSSLTDGVRGHHRI